MRIPVAIIIIAVGGALLLVLPTVLHDPPLSSVPHPAWLRLRNSIDVFETDMGHYPKTLSELWTSDGSLNWKGPYVRSKTDLVDSWSTEIRYECTQETYKLTSAGPDRTFDTGDDIKY